ncbi:MAG: DUF3306 domain-containing protein [Acidiferrobacterales bacterium]|nr:DUF3306 domain-containing protein [Acidiferrobacterales bacterium]
MTQSRLHEWSRRKAQEREESGRSDPPQPDEMQESRDIVQTEGTDDNREEVEAEEKTPVDLPSLESLDDDSDYSVFMSDEVDESIRKLALRRLFKAAVFNVRDGLNDYDDDFTTFEELGDIVTSDMKYHAERKKAEEEARRKLEAETEPVEEQQEIETLAGEEGEADDSVKAPDDEEPSTPDSEVAGEPDPLYPDERSTS